MRSEVLGSEFEKQSLGDKVKIAFLSRHEQIRMQDELICDLKPHFEELLKSKSEVHDDIPMIINLFDERIRSLPKESLYNLYKCFMQYKNARFSEDKNTYLEIIFNCLELSYGLDGWYSNKTG